MIEQTATPNPTLIDSAPGMPAVKAEVAGEQAGQPVPVEGFRGDPRRVIGHPSNVTNEAAQGYADQLRANSTEWSLPKLHRTGEIALQKILEKGDE